jgi:hypothetical protein
MKRACRKVNWDLHTEEFEAMLSWLAKYNCTNYARRSPVYLADIKALPATAPDVHKEFLRGKHSNLCLVL